MKPVIHADSIRQSALKNIVKKEDEGKAEDSRILSDQLVPDNAAQLVMACFPVCCGKQHHLYFSCFLSSPFPT